MNLKQHLIEGTISAAKVYLVLFTMIFTVVLYMVISVQQHSTYYSLTEELFLIGCFAAQGYVLFFAILKAATKFNRITQQSIKRVDF